VLLPMPGSPPSKVTAPGTMPPPSTRSSSGSWVDVGRLASVPTSPMRVGPGRLVGGGGATRSLSPPSTSSNNVFQSPQLPHCPDHFGYDVPHSLHAYTSLSFAMMDTLEMATHGVVPVAKVDAYGEPLTAVCCSLSVCQAADALETSACADPEPFS